MSKDVKPKQRIGHKSSPRKTIAIWTLLAAACAGAVFAAYHYTGNTKVEVPVARARIGEFVIAVNTRGEIHSVRSVYITTPQVPDPHIVKLAESGRPIKKGDVVVAFDPAQEEQTYLEKDTSVKTVDSQIVQTKATHQITNEMDGMDLLTSTYNVQRAKLEAGKAEILSKIDGEKDLIDVGVSEGALSQENTTIDSHKVTEKADLDRLAQLKDKTLRDLNRAKGYLSMMVIRAPIDGIVNILPNFRSSGSFGSSPPPFKEGDRAWTGAQIAEIPDLSEMRIELKLDEVDRGKLQLGQSAKIRVDALPDKVLSASLDWISPIATVNFRGPWMNEKVFPARATLKTLDPRLRPGMSASAEIVLESQPNSLLIPARASFSYRGKPAVYVQHGANFVIRPIQVGRRNDTDMVVLKGLKAGEIVALENPVEAAKKAKKL
ncbi:MAG: efflux RND transporter periplasmic adaptor subunit [Bryobacteraceae bacterium]